MRSEADRRTGQYLCAGIRVFSVLADEFVCKDSFIILKLMVYGIYISGRTFYPVKHKVAMPDKTDGAISIFFSRG